MGVIGWIAVVLHTLLFLFMRSKTKKKAKKHAARNAKLEVENRRLNAKINSLERN